MHNTALQINLDDPREVRRAIGDLWQAGVDRLMPWPDVTAAMQALLILVEHREVPADG